MKTAIDLSLDISDRFPTESTTYPLPIFFTFIHYFYFNNVCMDVLKNGNSKADFASTAYILYNFMIATNAK